MWWMVAPGLVKAAALAGLLLRTARASLRFSDRRFIVLVLGVAAVLRVGWILLVQPLQRTDALWFHQRAIEWASGLGFSVNGVPTARFPPGFPFVLSLVYRLAGAEIAAGQALNLILVLVGLVCCWRLAAALFDAEIARISTLALAVWPGQIAYAGSLLTEPLFGVLFLLSLLTGLRSARARKWVWSAALQGMLLGAATLTRPQALLWIVVLPFFLYSAARDWRRSALVTVLSGAVLVAFLAPWMLRNYGVYGTLVPITTSSGMVFWEGNHPGASGMASDGLKSPYKNRSDVLAAGREARQAAMDFIRTEPIEALRLYFLRLRTSSESDIDVAYVSLYDRRVHPLLTYAYLWLSQSYFTAIVVLFLGFIVHGCTSRRLGTWMAVVLPVAYFSLTQAVFVAQYRYTFPSVPFLALGAAVFMAWASSWLDRHSGAGERGDSVPCEALNGLVDH